MKIFKPLLILFLFIAPSSYYAAINFKENYSVTSQTSSFSYLKEGDIIFQISVSGQGKAIQQATKSKYTHVGMIFQKNGKWMVIEAVQPVKWTHLKTFIVRGDDEHFVIKRLINAENFLTLERIEAMEKMADSFAGKKYDIYFDWSDTELYCSELVWKIYHRVTGIEIGRLQQMREFDLTSEEVKKKLKERFGDNVPLEQNVISPAAIFESPLLETVKIP
jgi:hypothetical protein